MAPSAARPRPWPGGAQRPQRRRGAVRPPPAPSPGGPRWAPAPRAHLPAPGRTGAGSPHGEASAPRRSKPQAGERGEQRRGGCAGPCVALRSAWRLCSAHSQLLPRAAACLHRSLGAWRERDAVCETSELGQITDAVAGSCLEGDRRNEGQGVQLWRFSHGGSTVHH